MSGADRAEAWLIYPFLPILPFLSIRLLHLYRLTMRGYTNQHVRKFKGGKLFGFGKKKNHMEIVHRPKSVQRGVVISPGGNVSPHGSTYIRVLERLKIDYQPGLEWEHLPFSEAVKLIREQDFILVQRNALNSSQASEVVRLCRQFRTRLVFEIDDDLTIGSRIPEDQIDAVKTLLIGSDVVLTSTNYLRKRLRKYNRDVRVIPNKLCGETWLDDNYLIPPKEDIEDEGIKILYMGTYSHSDDLNLIRPALSMLNKNGIRATVYAVGIGKDIESENVKIVAVPSGWSIYPKFVKWLTANAGNFDFAIAPLENNEFNRCKSGLKYLDYGAIKLAGVFSESESYSSLVKHGETGLLVKNTTASWLRALERMCIDTSLRSRLANAAFNDTERHNLLDRRDSFIYAEALGIERGKYTGFNDGSNLILDADEFDPHWYVHSYDPTSFISGNNYPSMSATDAADHYLNIGANLGFDPGPSFSTRGYLEQYRDVEDAGINPLLHFLRHGKSEGRQPKPKMRTVMSRIRPDAQGPVAEILPLGKDYTPTQQTLSVHFHAYHPDLVDEAIGYLANIQQKFTLLVSARAEDIEVLKRKLSERLPLASLDIRALTNRGRDVAPWVVSFRDDVLRHDLFCHIHTKSTVHTEGHRNWRRHLLHETLASPATVSRILSLLDDPEIGLVIPPYFDGVSPQPKWGANRDRLFNLLDSMHYQGQRDYCENYPSGSFFWVRTEVLRPLLAMDLTLEDFEQEGGQKDGTLAHAIERAVGFLPSITGFDTVCTAVEKAVG